MTGGGGGVRSVPRLTNWRYCLLKWRGIITIIYFVQIVHSFKKHPVTWKDISMLQNLVGGKAKSSAVSI